MDFKKLIDSKEYDFLRTDEHLGNRIMLLTLGGSHAYGTNNENSDVDVRGIALEKPSDIIGFTEFKQVVETNTDTTIYAFNRFIELALNSNPNVIELFGCKPEHYIYLSKEGKQLLDNRKLFLTQRCINAFGGYANAQFNRLSNAIARDRVSQSEKEEHILKSLENTMMHFADRYTSFDENSIVLSIQDSKKDEFETEIYVDMTFKGYPLRDTSGILGEMNNVLRQYGKINHRNKKKDEDHLAKHMMHLVRLYLTVIDMLELEDIITYRGKDLDILLPIRHQKFLTADGVCTEDFYDLLEGLKNRFEYAKKNTSLPKEPDMIKVQDFVMEVNRNIIQQGS